jgi:alpha-amylase/alpha-mannosidase (GH57 family)
MSRRYICIHGHFYQPPRENAWLEAVEMQESAYPAHDWNDRISRECYATNAKARLLNDDGTIERTVSNYARMSFNFGPTLLAWMKDHAPGVYSRVIESDRVSADRFEGHGCAMAQGYNHAILPLCNERDRATQVRWGVRDFESRFGRKPEGMWMPETAADTPTLEALAEAGIAFTVLAPRQCAAVRPIGHDSWEEIGEGVDPTRAYQCRLPSGRTIALFFYDGPVSQGVAFEGLLNSGERFADRLMSGLDDARAHDQIMHIATDGESYGHHHRHGEMALAAALEHIERDPSVDLINYGLYLRRHPPTMEARIHENSSWSCVHGVERWRSDCGCNSGREGYHQRWRAPLRGSLDWLRDAIARRFEEVGATLFTDPWAAREGYIDVILDRSAGSIDAFLKTHAVRELDRTERTRALQLMELQRHAMLMYTSCAWFFDDISGIETVQVIQYAARVVQLAGMALGMDLEAEFLERIAHAGGNTRELPDGRAVFDRSVRPAMLALDRVAAHYAVHRLFDSPAARVYSYEIIDDQGTRLTSGRARLIVGNATFRSCIDFDEAHLSFCALHMGDHVVSCGVRPFAGAEAFEEVRAAATEAFERADFAVVLRIMDRQFGGTSYSIGSLFRDEQHTVVRSILKPALEQIDHSYRQIYEQHAPLAQFLRSLNLTVPRRIQLVGSFVLSQSLRHILESAKPDLRRAGEIVAEAARGGIGLDEQVVTRAVLDAMTRAITAPTADPDPVATCRTLLDLVLFVGTLPFAVDLWPLQEYFLEHLRPLLALLAERQDPESAASHTLISMLGRALEVRL